ncbi:hypothetical protein G7046_g78 [Stylonectria norvegica]|nr:hypothetical protein G7046_g78 [Stylonectria norvegica]
MADFRQLALEFVLADDEGRLTSIAKQAANAIQNAPPNTNPIARWVEAVQPWMPGSQGDETEEGDIPDWTARSRALEFLSRTLDFLGKDVLKPSQVKLLIGFFGAMFEVDHKAGILPSASALSRIVAVKAFQPQSGNAIIQKVCALKDDFPRQVSKTRLAVYQLLHLLVTTPDIASDLQNRHGPTAGFVVDLIQLCRSERDPDCLMVWFDILRVFLVDYSLSKELLEEVYGAFKPYFPIALPRASQTGITPDELKLQLRKCFSANYLLAEQAFDFLLGKLDQGEGVTVNVKVDILKTIKACLVEYSHPELAVIPYVDRIWSSLKYEVRNGEIEDTIWGTLEVLKTLATRLQGNNLRDYTLTVTRDCVNDLSNTAYTAAAGRSLVSVLSAKPSAFVLMVSPVITHVKENLRHPKVSMHSQDLLKILYVILETRILLVDAEMSTEDREDFAAVDTIIKSLYNDVYNTPVQLGSKSNASQDEIKIATQAVQGAGALVRQRPAKFSGLSDGNGPNRLLPEETCSQICEALFSILVQSITDQSQLSEADDLVDETTKALQRAVRSYPSGFKPLADKSISIIRSSWQDRGDSDASEIIPALGSHLAFVGCSELPKTPAEGFSHFIYYTQSLLSELLHALDAKAEPRVWCALAGAIQSLVRYFNDACLQSKAQDVLPFNGEAWQQRISDTYPALNGNDGIAAKVQGPISPTSSAAEIRNEFLLVGLFVVRQLYRRATITVEAHSNTGKRALSLSDDFRGSDQASEYQYLHLISVLAGFIVHEMSEAQQLSLKIEEYAFTLFREDFITLPTDFSQEQKISAFERTAIETGSTWSWLALERTNILSLGFLESLRPAAVAKLFDCGVAQELIISGCLLHKESRDSFSTPVTLSLLTILANKYNIETLETMLTTILEKTASLLKHDSSDDQGSYRLERLTSIYALAAGMLRRYSGKLAKGLLQLLRDAPKDTKLGHHLGRRLEMIVAPQPALTKENYAIVKPLWMQKVYFELASPMLQIAIGADAEIQDAQTKASFSIGVLLMVKHMNFPIYEADADKILRIAIAIAQSTGTGPDAKAALDVLRKTLVEAPEKGQDHLRSITDICITAFSNKPAPSSAAWLPQEPSDPEAQAGCGKLGLEIIGGLPRMFESRYLVPLAAQVERELTIACGHRVRDLRRTARLARAAWTELK